MNVDSSTSLSGPSSKRSAFTSSRSTAMYRIGCVTTAVRKTVWPESRLVSPRKPDAPVPDDLVPRGVENGHLALEDRDQRVARVADTEEDITDLGRALLAVLGERVELRLREDCGDGRHPRTVPIGPLPVAGPLPRPSLP